MPVERYAPLARAARVARRLAARSRTFRAACAQSPDSSRARHDSTASTAGRSFGSSSPASRGCSGPGRSGRWTKRRAALDAFSRRGRHLRRGRGMGPCPRSRGAAPRDPVGRPAAWLHLPALAQLSPRSRRDASRDAATRGFPAPTLTLLFDEYAAEHLATAGGFRRPRSGDRQSELDALIRRARDCAVARRRSRRTRPRGRRRRQSLVLYDARRRKLGPCCRRCAPCAAMPEGVAGHQAAPSRNGQTSMTAAVRAIRSVDRLDAATPLAPLLAACAGRRDRQLDRGARCRGRRDSRARHRLAEQPFAVRRRRGVGRGRIPGRDRQGNSSASCMMRGSDSSWNARGAGSSSSHAMRSDGAAAARSAEAVLEVARTVRCAC